MAFVQRIRHAWDATMDLIERAARPVDWRFFSSYGEPNAERVHTSFDEYARRAYGGNAAVFGIVNAQMRLFSEARFKLRDADKKLHDHECLRPLEHPWPNGTTGDLLARMRQDATLAGNAYVRKVGADQLERLRPDWVTIVSWVRDGVTEGQETPDGRQLREVLGFLYEPLGDTGRQPEFYPVEEVAHWAPTPDPMANWRGMSPITPAIKEINADLSMTLHRQKFFDNAATPNLILKYANKLGTEQRNRIRDAVAARHGGPSNAGGTLVLDEGADPMVVGSQFRDAQFDEIMAAGENRIAVALGVPAIVAGLKQGQDAAAWSMYKQALRAFADIGVRPDWRSACAALAVLVDVPEGYCLWYDTTDISALQEGEQEQAAVLQTQLAAISTAITAGFQPDSATAAVIAGDLSLLEHTGMVSVQMHDPAAEPVDPAAAGADPDQAGDAKPDDDTAGSKDNPDQADDARRAQLLDLLDEILRAWDPELHPRDHRGRFRGINAPDLLNGTVPVGKLHDRRLEQLHSKFANDPSVNHNPAVFALLGDEMDRRDQLAAYRRLVDSVPHGHELRQLPEDDVMRLYAEVSAVNDERDMDRPTFDRLGAELDRRVEVQQARDQLDAMEYLGRDLEPMTADELTQAGRYAAELGDEPQMDRVMREWDARKAGTAKAPKVRGHSGITAEEETEIDRMVATGAGYAEAYAAVLDLDVNKLRREEAAAAAGGGPGRTVDKLRKAYEEHTYLQFLDAENETNGYLLNRRAHEENARRKARKELEIDPYDLFSGPAHVANAYASEELLRYWAKHPRMSFAEYQLNVTGQARAGRQMALAAGKGNEFA